MTSTHRSGTPHRVALIGATPGSVQATWLAQCAGPGTAVIGTGRDGPRALSLVRDGGVDAIVLAAAGAAYHDLILSALELGVAVCCEPPLAPTLRAAAELTDAARRAPAPAVVAFPWREHLALRDARDTIAAGQIGDLLAIDLAVHDTAPGVVSAVIHQLDLLRWLTRLEWTVESAWSGGLGSVPQDRPGPGVTTIGLSTAVPDTYGRIFASRLCRGEPRFQLTAIGTRGTLLVVVSPADGFGLWRLTSGSGSHERVFGSTSTNPYPRFLGDGDGPSFDDALTAQRLARAAAELATGVAARRPAELVLQAPQ